MKVIIYEGFWTRKSVEEDEDNLYIYGDNDIGKGMGGQAIIRYLENTAGIPTKKAPSFRVSAFYTDHELEENKKKINNAIENIKELSKSFKAVVFPKDGFGTGLAKLDKVAPKTFDYVVEQVEELKKWLKDN